MPSILDLIGERRDSGSRSTSKIDAYTLVGVSFAVIGELFALSFYLIVKSIPLTALGIAISVVGVSIAMIPQSPVPVDAIRDMVEEACINVELVLEAYDASEKAWYMPARDGRVCCFIPLDAEYKTEAVWAASRAPVELLTEPMGTRGLMVYPPWSDVARLSQLSDEDGLEDSMAYVLIDFLEAAENVKVQKEGDRIKVSIGNPRLRLELLRFNSVLGSPTVSVLGCVAATVLKSPVRISEEMVEDKNLKVNFEVLSPG